MKIIKKRRLATEALNKILAHHDRFCKMHTWERRCTCGRNQAIAELRVLLKTLQVAEGKS